MTIEQKAEVWLTDFNKGGGWRKAAWLAGHAAAVEEYKELNGWVKVSERLPEAYTRCLVYCYDDYRLATYLGNGVWKLNGMQLYGITHYKLLTPPIKQKQ